MISHNVFDMSLIVIAMGPERLVARAIEGAARQTSPSTELVVVHESEEAAARLRVRGFLRERPVTFVRPDSTTPGAARNAGVRRSGGRFFLISDGSESLPDDRASNGSDALNSATDADFAAAAGGFVVWARYTPGPRSSAESMQPPSSAARGVWGRPSCDAAHSTTVEDSTRFIPVLVDWDFLLTLCQTRGSYGVIRPIRDPATPTTTYG